MAAVGIQLDQEVDSLPLGFAPSARQQKCVLLIEDSEDAMLLVKFALEEYAHGRYRLEWAHSLIEGLEQISQGNVDVILLDLGLPEARGPESYAWIRQIAPNVPVVVLTADESQETEFAVTASGVEEYLVKDQVSGVLLVRAIRTALHRAEIRKGPHDPVVNLFRPRFRENL
jgi:CheY-like chemotaxis protein